MLHKLVSGVITGGLIALVGWLSVQSRKRKVAKAEALAPAPVEDPSQALLRRAQEADRHRDDLMAQGHWTEALRYAGEAADRWRRLTAARPGRFRGELRTALERLGELLDSTGRTAEAARVRHEAAGLV
ncbi:protein of unknown function (plasmid) [Streptantibioticus cattleyicolor NRRL 8057 = DSM 46488]|nr:protein of unknown function [Streptantibioticus cattleyicolor NRRL 8057 = DSM 46488]